MPKLLIVYDDADPTIGTNSMMCYQHLQSTLVVNDHSITVFDGAASDCNSIQSAITGLQESPFIFIAYSHGDVNCLKSHIHGEYVNTQNSYYFGDSLFYTNACSAGQILGKNLIGQNCKVFIGYFDEVRVPDKVELEKLFIICENHAISLFLNRNLSIWDCFMQMKDMYDTVSDVLIANGETAWAARLLYNRSALTFDGNKLITRSDYY